MVLRCMERLHVQGYKQFIQNYLGKGSKTERIKIIKYVKENTGFKTRYSCKKLLEE